MKGKSKTQKGITLVALIITIVVLLILAVVSINAIQNDGIMSKAQGATDKFNKKQSEEESILGEYEELFDKYDDVVGREGTTVAYDSDEDGEDEEWIILTDREGLVEIVSKNVMGSLTLGCDDTSVTVTTDLNGDDTVDYKDIAIASYNNAITTINNYCKSLVTATDNDGVRSVGGTDNSYTPYSSTNYDNWGVAITVDVASTDENYKTDFERMIELGIVTSDGYYWIASRLVEEYTSYIGFYVKYVTSSRRFGT